MVPDRPRVLVAHALASYAEALTDALANARPCLDVQLVAPAELDARVSGAAGAVVVTDLLTPAVETHAGGWLLYYPDQENVAVVGTSGTRRRIETPSFRDILASVDDLVAAPNPLTVSLDAIAHTINSADLFKAQA